MMNSKKDEKLKKRKKASPAQKEKRKTKQARNKEILKEFKGLQRQYKDTPAKELYRTYLKPKYKLGYTTFLKILKDGKVNVQRTLIKPPTKKDLVFIISLYVGLPKRFNICCALHNEAYRTYLSEVVSKRGFLERIAKEDMSIMLDYFYTFPYQNKIELSKQYFKGNTHKGQKVINKYLCMLVNEIMQDFKAGKLKVKEYTPPPKPPTKRERLRGLRELFKKDGINIKVPLRKESKKEEARRILKGYEAHLKELNQRYRELNNKQEND